MLWRRNEIDHAVGALSVRGVPVYVVLAWLVELASNVKGVPSRVAALDVPRPIVEGHMRWIGGVDRVRRCVHRLNQVGGRNDLAVDGG